MTLWRYRPAISGVQQRWGRVSGCEFRLQFLAPGSRWSLTVILDAALEGMTPSRDSPFVLPTVSLYPLWSGHLSRIHTLV